MKKLIAILLALAMLLAMAACTSNEPAPTDPPAVNDPTEPPVENNDPTEPPETIELTWWTSYGEANVGYLQTAIDAFNESQSAYHMTIIFQESLAAKLAATQQSDLPDIFNGAVENVAEYDAASYCANLQPYVDADTAGWPELDSTWASLRAAYSDTEGKLVGYPIGYSYGGIYYNVEMFKEAGIDPATLTDLDAIYEASKKLVDGGYCAKAIGFHPDGFFINAMLAREGVLAYDNDNGYSGKITKNLYTEDAAVNAAVKGMLEYFQKSHAEDLVIAYGSNHQKEVMPEFNAGNCAMYMTVVSMTTKILNGVNGTFEVGMIPLPSITAEGKREALTAGGNGLFVCNNGDEARMQGAYEFIKFMSKGEWAAHFATKTGYLAPSQAAFDSDVYQDYVKNVWPNVTTIYDDLAAAEPDPNPYVPISAAMKSANKLMVETVTADTSADIDAAIQVAYETIQEAIELFNMANP